MIKKCVAKHYISEFIIYDGTNTDEVVEFTDGDNFVKAKDGSLYGENKIAKNSYIVKVNENDALYLDCKFCIFSEEGFKNFMFEVNNDNYRR